MRGVRTVAIGRDIIGGLLIALAVISSPARSVAQTTVAAGPIILSEQPAAKAPAHAPSVPSMAYCVRLCDGWFFPLPRSAVASAADQCRAFCPGAKVKVFSGNAIDQAVSADGGRYGHLPTAFVYRKRLIDRCTCNGRNAFGVARQDLATDRSLRSGDLVALDNGFAVYSGAKNTLHHRTDFTPLPQSYNVSEELRRRLTMTKIVPTLSRMSRPAPVENAAVLIWGDTQRTRFSSRD